MRPATAYSADGPANLLQAVTAAASPLSKDRGALITMNDRVGSAWYTQKTHGKFSMVQTAKSRADSPVNYLDTFKAPEPGYLGGFFNNELFYYNSPAKPTCEYRGHLKSFVKLILQSKRRLTSPTSPPFPELTLSTDLKNSMLESWRLLSHSVMSRGSSLLLPTEVLVPMPLSLA